VGPVRFVLFGRVAVDRDGAVHRLAPGAAALLARLVLAQGRLVTIVELCRTMRPAHAGPVRREHRVAVQKRISELRRLVDPCHPGESSQVLQTDRGATTAYRLVVERDRVDVFRFEDLVERAWPAEPRVAAVRLRRALAVWRERPLMDFEDRDFALEPVRHLWRLRESARRQLALAHRDAGQAAQALAVVSELVADARDDPALHQLAEDLRAQVRGAGPPAVEAVPVPAAPRELPPDVPGFVGRGAELAHLDGLLAEGDDEPTAAVVATVCGTAGVGKTALAVHWAHRVAAHFGDGQLYVNLRGFDPGGAAVRPAEAVRGFLDALGVPPAAVPASVDAQIGRYRSLLAGRRVLVVLDNARDADQVRPLLPGSPGCLAVVTSRNQLPGLVAMGGARPMTLDLLPPAQARELLERHLGAARVAAEPGAVEDIVAACARLPLALAVAAARAATHPWFPLRVLADELREARDGLDAFDVGDPATDVRAVFSWSYRALGEPAARLFRLLSVHPGEGVSRPAAAGLAGVPVDQVRAPLAELARAHLVAQQTPGRYALHELLHAYAGECSRTVDSDAERRAALRRLLDHYLQSALAADRLLNPHRDPIAVTPSRCAAGSAPPLADREQALAWFAAERAALVGAVRRAAGTGFDTHVWQLTWALAEFLERRGHWREWLDVQQAAIAAAVRLADRPGEAHARRGLALACGRLGRYDDAQVQHRRALALFGDLGNHSGQAHSHRGLAWTFGLQGCNREALWHGQRALDLYRVAGNRVGQARALNSIGWDHAQLGDHQQALAFCRRALALLEETGDRYGQAETWDSLGYAHHHLRHHHQAVACYRRALDLYRETGDRFNEADTLTHLGDTHQAGGAPERARDAWRQALSILTELRHCDADEVRARLDPHGTRDVRPGAVA
jgi:tetratricopeptide (TPR) repeat protein